MKQHLGTKTAQYFVVRKIPHRELIVEAIDMQNEVIQNPSTVKAELYRDKTRLAIVFLGGSNNYVLTVQEKDAEPSLVLKEFTDAVQQKDYCFKYQNLGPADCYGLSTETTTQMYIYITKESVVNLTTEITRSVPVKEEEVESSPT